MSNKTERKRRLKLEREAVSLARLYLGTGTYNHAIDCIVAAEVHRAIRLALSPAQKEKKP